MAQARENLERAIVESPRGDAFELANVVKGASQLERRVLVLAARAEYLGSFLASVSAPELRNELERVRARERGALAADARQTLFPRRPSDRRAHPVAAPRWKPRRIGWRRSWTTWSARSRRCRRR